MKTVLLICYLVVSTIAFPCDSHNCYSVDSSEYHHIEASTHDYNILITPTKLSEPTILTILTAYSNATVWFRSESPISSTITLETPTSHEPVDTSVPLTTYGEFNLTLTPTASDSPILLSFFELIVPEIQSNHRFSSFSFSLPTDVPFEHHFFLSSDVPRCVSFLDLEVIGNVEGEVVVSPMQSSLETVVLNTTSTSIELSPNYLPLKLQFNNPNPNPNVILGRMSLICPCNGTVKNDKDSQTITTTNQCLTSIEYESKPYDWLMSWAWVPNTNKDVCSTRLNSADFEYDTYLLNQNVLVNLDEINFPFSDVKGPLKFFSLVSSNLDLNFEVNNCSFIKVIWSANSLIWTLFIMACVLLNVTLAFFLFSIRKLKIYLIPVLVYLVSLSPLLFKVSLTASFFLLPLFLSSALLLLFLFRGTELPQVDAVEERLKCPETIFDIDVASTNISKEKPKGRIGKLVWDCRIVLILLFLSAFFFLPLPNVFEWLESNTCAPSVITDSGDVTFWSLTGGGDINTVQLEVPFNFEFQTTPSISYGIAGIQISSKSKFDLQLVQLDSKSFILRLVTDGQVDQLSLNWMAVEEHCNHLMNTEFFSSPLLSNATDPNWTLNEQSGKFSHSLPLTTNLEDGFFKEINSLTGFGFKNHHSNILIDSNTEPSPSFITITSESLVSQARINTLLLDYSLLPNSKVLTDTFILGTGGVTWSFDDPLNSDNLFYFFVSFEQEFLKIPNIFLFVNGFSTSSQLGFSLQILNRTFTGFTISVQLPLIQDVVYSLDQLSLSYIAFDLTPSVFSFFDGVIAIGFIVILGISIYASFSSPPSNCFTGTKQEEFQLPGPGQSSKHLPPKLSTVLNDSRWVKMVMHYVKERKIKTTHRTTSEKIVLLVFGVSILLIFSVFFNDFIYERRLLHQFDSWWLSIAILSLEYAILVFAMLSHPYTPHREPSKGTVVENPHNVAVLIASYMSSGRDPRDIENSFNRSKSAHSLGRWHKMPNYEDFKTQREETQKTFERSLKMACLSVADGNVFVCHNTGSLRPNPNDETVKIVEKVYEWGSTVKYYYTPVGNKTAAIRWVCDYILEEMEHIEYVVIMDDDCIIPHKMNWQTHLLSDDDIAGGVIGIRADQTTPFVDAEQQDYVKAIASGSIPEGKRPNYSWSRRKLLTWMQDFEYILAGYTKHFQSSWGTANYNHGACAIYKKSVLKHILNYHNTQFDGEDALMGFILREHPINGTTKRLITLIDNPVLTQVPQDLIHLREDLFGQHVTGEKSLFAQRVKSWDVCAHRFFFKFVKHLLRYWDKKTLILKPFYANEIWTIFQDYLRIYIVVYYLRLGDGLNLLYILLRVIIIQWIMFFVFNFVKLRYRRDLRSPWIVVFLFPFYRLLLLTFRICAILQLFKHLSDKGRQTAHDHQTRAPFLSSYFELIKHPVDLQKVWDPELLVNGVPCKV
ncbi:hypothetical protein P9112_000227 [Eukaryota sp. TZLM1-RC]